MFGHHEWVKVKGIVAAADREEAQYADGAMGQIVGSYAVDVQPEGEASFRAQVWPGGFNVPGFHAESSHFQHPVEGQTVALEYDRKSHEVRFDMEDPSNFKPGMHDRNAQAHSAFEQALQGAPGSASTDGADTLSQIVAMAQQSGGGVRVVNLRDSSTPGGAPGDPVERLTKLAKLKEMGLVDDAQFAELKAKILSES